MGGGNADSGVGDCFGGADRRLDRGPAGTTLRDRRDDRGRREGENVSRHTKDAGLSNRPERPSGRDAVSLSGGDEWGTSARARLDAAAAWIEASLPGPVQSGLRDVADRA